MLSPWIISIPLLLCSMMTSTQTTPPNIIIFIIDDMPFLHQFNESAPDGVDLINHTVEYDDYPTPNISAFRDEAVIFPKSYCGGPKCSPSRFSVLTGRLPSRNEWAIKETLRMEDGSEGTDVSVINSKISGNDTVYNLPRVLQDNGYYTGTVGKWHLMPGDDNGYNIGCDALEDTPDAVLYGECTDIVKEVGFDYVDGWYYSNIANNDYFSHNPEWMVSRAQQFIDEAVDEEDKPFFLYFASTLVHSGSDVFEALKTFNITDSPKGTLSGDEVPDDTTMRPRDEIWNMARNLGSTESFSKKKCIARNYWIDDQFGALIDYLRTKGIYDDTMVILQGDHGVEAKGMLYEQGSRIMNFVRYPPLFGSDQVVLSDDLVVSNLDLAPTIFDFLGVSVPNEYVMDGTSWLLDVTSALSGTELLGGNSCCEYRYIDVKYSRSIVSSQYQYIWRANDDVETAGNVDSLYLYTYDDQQLYDLESDPNQQINLIADYESYRSDDSDGSLSSTITTFQSMMREYTNSTCPLGDGGCDMPSYTFCSEVRAWSHQWSSITSFGNNEATTKLQEAEELIDETYPDCASNISSVSYVYEFTYYYIRKKLSIDIEICCGDDGASFPGDYVEPTGFSYSGDANAFNFDSVSSSSEWDWSKGITVAVIALVICCCCGITVIVFWKRIKEKRRKLEKIRKWRERGGDDGDREEVAGGDLFQKANTAMSMKKIEKNAKFIEDHINISKTVDAKTEQIAKEIEIVECNVNVEDIEIGKDHDTPIRANGHDEIVDAFDL